MVTLACLAYARKQGGGGVLELAVGSDFICAQQVGQTGSNLALSTLIIRRVGMVAYLDKH